MFIYKDKKIYVVILVYAPYSQKRNIRTLEDKAPNKRQIIYKNKNMNVNIKYKFIYIEIWMLIDTYTLTYGKNIYMQLFIYAHSLYS